MVADLARLERRPPETLVVTGKTRSDDHGAYPLEAHALALIVFRLRGPRKERGYVLGHLYSTNFDRFKEERGQQDDGLWYVCVLTVLSYCI